MSTVITYVIDSDGSKDFTTLQSWEDAAPSNLVNTSKFTCGSFSGTFVLGETVTGGTSGKTGKMVNTDGSTYMWIGDASGTFTNGETLTGGTSVKTCTITTPATDTGGIIWQGQGWYEEYAGTTTRLTISGSTSVDSTHYKELTAYPGFSFMDSANVQTNPLRYIAAGGTAIRTTNGYGASPVIISEDYVRLSKLMLQQTGTGGTTHTINCTGNTPGVLLSNLIVEAYSNSGSPIGSYNCQIRNSLFIHRGSAPTQIAGVGTAASMGPTYGCIFVSIAATATYGFKNKYGTSNPIENCYVGNATNFEFTSGKNTYTNCATSCASAPSGVTTSVAFSTSSGAYFQNITNGSHDLRIQSSSSLKDAGGSPTASNYYSGVTGAASTPIDIAGTTRPSGTSYDIGCWEYVQAVLDNLMAQTCL